MNEIMMNKVGTYSNGLVAFIVLQGLAYSYYFGANKVFNCMVHQSAYLPEALTAVFIVVAILAFFAIKKLGKLEVELAPEYEPIIDTLTRGKLVVILIFGLFPCALTFFYGVLGPTPIMCDLI